LGGSVPRSKKRSVHVRRHIRNRPDFVRFAFSNIFYTDDFPSQGRRRSPLLAPKKPPEAQKLIFLIFVVLKPTMERFSCKKIPGAGVKKSFSYGGIQPYLRLPPLRCHYIFKSMPIAGFAPLGAADALMPAIPGRCLWALCAKPPDGRDTYRKKSIFQPRPPPAANSTLATLGLKIGPHFYESRCHHVFNSAMRCTQLKTSGHAG